MSVFNKMQELGLGNMWFYRITFHPRIRMGIEMNAALRSREINYYLQAGS